MKVYNKPFEKVLIVLTIVAVILSIFNTSLIPFIFTFPAILFFVRLVHDFSGKNDSQASKNLKTAVIFFIILCIFNTSLIPFIFSFPAILFLVRMVQDFTGKNDSQSSKNLTPAVIFVIIFAITFRLLN